MIYSLGPLLVLVSIALLTLGGRQGKPWALYVLKAIWVALAAIALFFTVEAWKGSAYSENWEMIGVIFIAWPISGFISLSAIAEMILLKGKRDRHARINRWLSAFFAVFMVLLALSPLAASHFVRGSP